MRRSLLLAILLLQTAGGTAHPAPNAVSIRFARNATSATLHGTLAPGQEAHYTLDATEGQKLFVRLACEKGKGLITVGPGGSGPVYEGAFRVTEWSGKLPDDGPHEITVTAGDAPLTYALLVTIPPYTAPSIRRRLRNASRQFDFEIEIRNPHPSTGIGPGTVRVLRKGTKTPVQVLDLAAIQLNDQISHNPSLDRKARSVYDDEYSVVVEDFNFDGHDDLAICDGHEASYGLPSYTVFLWSEKQGRFEEHETLTRLAHENLGLFERDAKRRVITTYAKSGCCWHQTDTYRFQGSRPVLIESVIDDALGERGVITTKRRVGGKWVTRVRHYTIKDEQ